MDLKFFLHLETLAWDCIARDDFLECKCGLDPYDNGNPCPKCFAILHLVRLKEFNEELELAEKKTLQGSNRVKKSKPLNESRGSYVPSPNAKPPPPQAPPIKLRKEGQIDRSKK